MYKKGFTLAEVLTTLMVIGVVAAMTIPTLMNSTNDQQLKVAYKKAVSVLSQGIQLMVAKEVECSVQSSSDLADCFAKNVLSGTVVDKDNSHEDVAIDVVSTSDGLAYKFFYNPSAPAGQASDGKRSLEDICGTNSKVFVEGRELSDYAGDTAVCGVVVDLNGFSKGTKSFKQRADSLKDLTNGSEQLPLIITGNGVRPVYNADESVNTGINKGYAYLFGNDNIPVSSGVGELVQD